ncbi:MAG: hypothetical protein JKX76_00965 [Colwellia sp.]|nr:hypothetical protein [Colwellia sp.]
MASLVSELSNEKLIELIHNVVTFEKVLKYILHPDYKAEWERAVETDSFDPIVVALEIFTQLINESVAFEIKMKNC